MMVSVLADNLGWLINGLTPTHTFCLKFITLCCQKMGTPSVVTDLQWLCRYRESTIIIGCLYFRIKKMPSVNPDFEEYKCWVHKMKEALMCWKKKIEQKEVNYDQLSLYTKNNELIERVVTAYGFKLQSCLLFQNRLTELNTSILKRLKVLQEHLIKCIPNQPQLQW